MTGFTVVPLQLFSMLGMIVSGVSLLLFVYLILDRILHGPDVQGVFTLFAIVFFLLGLALFGIGLIGEYVGRTYEQVRGRPRYLVAAVLAPVAGSRIPSACRCSKPPVFSAVVFAYSEVGLPLPAGAARPRRAGAAAVHARGSGGRGSAGSAVSGSWPGRKACRR